MHDNLLVYNCYIVNDFDFINCLRILMYFDKFFNHFRIQKFLKLWEFELGNENCFFQCKHSNLSVRESI